MVDINELLDYAKERNASDVHITVGVPPKIRVNGSLENTEFPVMTVDSAKATIEAIMPEKQKKIFMKMGETDFSVSVSGIGRYRINVFRQRGAMAAALRVVGTTIPKPEDLLLPEALVETHKKKRGLVLVTGPTGSGKSTSLAAIINLINLNSSSHIITLEDPIEYLHRHKSAMVNQREIGMDTLSYANSLRAALREDPDVILVGEMRDLETISIAVTAAETGHLVFSTLHTIGAASTVDRIIDVFPTYQQQQIRIQLSAVLEAVISQQLIPKADGTGRVAAFEVMVANAAIRNLIRESKSHQIESSIQTGAKAGMKTMDDSIYDLYQKGIITKRDAVNFSQDVVAMTKKIGIRY